MKKFSFLVLIFTIFYSSIYTQNDIYSKLFIFNQGMYNPAATGLNGKNYVVSDFSLKFLKLNPKPFRLSAGYEYHNEKIKSTFALYDYYDQYGGLTNTHTIGLSYNYYFTITPGISIKTGLQFNMVRRMFDFDQFENGDQIDPVTGEIIETNLPKGKVNGIKPDINLGLYLQIRDFSFGASVANVFSPAFIADSADHKYFQLPRCMTVLLKYDILFSDKFILTPSIFYFDQGKFEFDLNYLDLSANFNFFKMINLGTVFSLGKDYQVSVFAGVKIIRKINIQINYWFETNHVLHAAGPTIEGLISYSIN